MSDSQPQPDSYSEDAANFTQWALTALRCRLNPQDGGVCEASLPEALRDRWQGKETLLFQTSSNGQAAADNVLAADVGSELFRWAAAQLQAAGPAVHAMPSKQPASVHEISAKLFAHYGFADGHIHLAGCMLKDVPVLRLTASPGDDRNNASPLKHHYFDRNGAPLEDDLVAGLHLDDITPLEDRPPSISSSDVESAITAARRHLGPAEPIAAALIWCKHAEGKLAFESGDQTVHLPFEGWARLLAEGTSQPPAYKCPLSRQQSYRLGVTDDGRIAAAEGIVACEESGRRVLITEVETCAATGKRVLPEHLTACSASGVRVLQSELVECSQCSQTAAPDAVKGGRCSACRSLSAVRKDDPRMARLLDEYPKLDRWSSWKIAETDANYLLLASSWVRRLLLVVDKQSLEVKHIATSGRVVTSWSELPSGQREELLG